MSLLHYTIELILYMYEIKLVFNVFRASKSPYAKMLSEYVEAENAGKGQSGASECWPYMKDCPKSLFLQRHNHYRLILQQIRESKIIYIYRFFTANNRKRMKLIM